MNPSLPTLPIFDCSIVFGDGKAERQCQYLSRGVAGRVSSFVKDSCSEESELILNSEEDARTHRAAGERVVDCQSGGCCGRGRRVRGTAGLSMFGTGLCSLALVLQFSKLAPANVLIFLGGIGVLFAFQPENVPIHIPLLRCQSFP